MKAENPLFEHDCDRCVFLGNYEDGDLYYHSGQLETVIYRYGSDGPDYVSGIGGIFASKELGEAHKRAVELGLVTLSV
jgi:hypothetical protein